MGIVVPTARIGSTRPSKEEGFENSKTKTTSFDLLTNLVGLFNNGPGTSAGE